MDRSLARAYVIELLGTFALVFFGAGVVCVNQLTAPPHTAAGAAALHSQQPGVVGMALAQGLILAVALAATLHRSGGYLNPAITIMLWVFNRLGTLRAVWLIGAQLLGAVLAGYCLTRAFDVAVLRDARLGTPHLNLPAYAGGAADASLRLGWDSVASGTGIELALTFFLVFAIFGTTLGKARGPAAGSPAGIQERQPRAVEAPWAALMGGLALTAGALVAQPLTGAAANPARWLGTVLWELRVLEGPAAGPGPLADMFVYIAGPILGALLAGGVYFHIMVPAELEARPAATPPAKAAEPRGAAPAKGKK
jgi:aquaporin Z